MGAVEGCRKMKQWSRGISQNQTQKLTFILVYELYLTHFNLAHLFFFSPVANVNVAFQVMLMSHMEEVFKYLFIHLHHLKMIKYSIFLYFGLLWLGD